MPNQSPLHFVKRWRRYQDRENWPSVPKNTRGVYVLYRSRPSGRFDVCYIGVSGLGPNGTGGIRRRLKRHVKKKKGWTHFSLFEVHDNITREEIREFEALLLGIFRHDQRIQLSNKQTGSRKLYQLQKTSNWDDKSSTKGVATRRRGHQSRQKRGSGHFGIGPPLPLLRRPRREPPGPFHLSAHDFEQTLVS